MKIGNIKNKKQYILYDKFKQVRNVSINMNISFRVKFWGPFLGKIWFLEVQWETEIFLAQIKLLLFW